MARSLGQRQRRPFENNEKSGWVGPVFKRFLARQTKTARGRSRDVVEETCPAPSRQQTIRLLHERVAAALPSIRKMLPDRFRRRRSLSPRNDVTCVHVRLSYACMCLDIFARLAMLTDSLAHLHASKPACSLAPVATSKLAGSRSASHEADTPSAPGSNSSETWYSIVSLLQSFCELLLHRAVCPNCDTSSVSLRRVMIVASNLSQMQAESNSVFLAAPTDRAKLFPNRIHTTVPPRSMQPSTWHA